MARNNPKKIRTKTAAKAAHKVIRAVRKAAKRTKPSDAAVTRAFNKAVTP